MNSEWLGKGVSVDCGGLGFFQGVISSVQLDEQTITLKKAFHNGVATQTSTVSLSAEDIKDLQILDDSEASSASAGSAGDKSSAAAAAVATSTVHVPRKKKNPVAENLVVNKARQSVGVGSPAAKSASAPQQRRSPVKKPQQQPPSLMDLRLDETCGSGGVGGERVAGGGRARTTSEAPASRGTPNRREIARLRDEDCFGSPVDVDTMKKEFDFEKNLALFDKQSVFSAIDEEKQNQPDLVRLVDCNKRQQEPKFKNSDHVLTTIPAQLKAIETGEFPPGEFMTDAGLVVPAVSPELRERLYAAADAHGLGMEKMSELVARAATEIAIQLFGGAHRLNPTNTHQVPLAVVLCGANRSGAFGLATARHLASHGVRTVVHLPELPLYPRIINTELKLYKLTGQKIAYKSAGLPSTAVDLIVAALEDHEMWAQDRSQPWHRAATKWSSGCSAPVLAVDPPPQPPAAPAVKISLLPGGMPLAHSDAAGKLYLVNLGIPERVYKEVGVKYSSPFGAKSVIPLHAIRK